MRRALLMGLLLILPALALADPSGPQPSYRIDVVGAWEVPQHKVRVQVDVGDPDYVVQVPRAIAHWEATLDAFGVAIGHPGLGLLHFDTSIADPDAGQACVAQPAAGQRQRLRLPDGMEVCLQPPQALQPGQEVIIHDVPMLVPLGTGWPLGITGGGANLLWMVRDGGLALDDGHLQAPILMLVANAAPFGLPDAVDKFNIALHEFGHAIGVGHTEDVDDDLMASSYEFQFVSEERCVSTLDTAALLEAYGWLGGAYEAPDAFTTLPIAQYQGRAYCA